MIQAVSDNSIWDFVYPFVQRTLYTNHFADLADKYFTFYVQENTYSRLLIVA